MKQIVDLQNDPSFQALGVALVSIAADTPIELEEVGQQYGTTIPLLSDTNKRISDAYDVLQWAVATDEPGHTFVLVNTDGTVAWIRDYGAPQNGGVMYVPVDELTQQIGMHLTS